MTSLPFALVTAVRATELELTSALPGAPIVATCDRAARPRAIRTRTALAGALHRAAHVVSPA